MGCCYVAQAVLILVSLSRLALNLKQLFCFSLPKASYHSNFFSRQACFNFDSLQNPNTPIVLLFLPSNCVCISERVCMFMYVHVWVCGCQRWNLGAVPQDCFLRQLSLMVWNLLIQLDWMAGELHSLAGSVSPALSLQCASPCPAFYVGSGGRKLTSSYAETTFLTLS